MDPDSWLIIDITLAFSAFFSGMEIAFVSANRLKIELDNKQGLFSAKILSHFLQHPKLFIASMLVGNNVALVFYGITAGQTASFLLFGVNDWSAAEGPYVALGIQTLITTIVILLTAEFLPKAFFKLDPNKWLNIFALPLLIIYYALWGPSWVITSISKGFIRGVLKGHTHNEKVNFGTTDLDHFLREATENMGPDDEPEHEIQILQNALDFSKTKARDCLIPRNEIVALPLLASIEELRETFIETGLSKIVIYRENIDNIIGYAHSYDLFKRPVHIKNILLPAFIVPEPMAAHEVLEQFIKNRRNLAIVVDEFGGTSGIITIEDIVEELFGEIEDEHDKEELIERDLGNGHFIFSGRLEIDYLNESYGFDLPENEQYETLGGLLIHYMEDIPDEGAHIRIEKFAFRVTKVDSARIDLVELKTLEAS
jgi:putative hemolysin